MEESLIYLDTYVLQQDMRIRLPKSIVDNLGAKKGETKFKIYFDKSNNRIILETLKDERVNQ